MESCDKLRNLLTRLTGKVLTEECTSEALELLSTIQKYVAEDRNLRFVNANDIDEKWERVGSGHFGHVYSSRYGGSRVAIKVFKEESASKMREGKILGSLSHENIIAFRGIGYLPEEKASDLGIPKAEDTDQDRDGTADKTRMFLVMEYIDQNLFKYVNEMRFHERKGLAFDKVWYIGQQITSALNYLHNLDITHRDLKPDNILLEFGPRRIVVKLADFGLASDPSQVNTTPPRGSSIKGSLSSTANSSMSVANVRWGAPEVFKSRESSGTKWTVNDHKAADIYCLGNVLTFTLTGEVPYGTITTFDIGDRIGDSGYDETIVVPTLPKSLTGKLMEVVKACMDKDAKMRPNASDLLTKYFGFDENPYLQQFDPETEAEFFSCGFMDKTDIFVADSCTDIEASQIGYYKSGAPPSGYDHDNLLCPIEIGETPYRDIPEWAEDDYNDAIEDFMDKVNEGKIDNNPTVALKKLVFSRPGEDECQKIAFEFKESEYVHHRSMRKIWTELTAEVRNNLVKAKGDVNSAFSNTFGLHVAVLTNEGPNAPQKFLFPRRASTVGMSSPGKYTCGAVESASKPDYKYYDGQTYVDLVNTAARGLKEEIGLELSGSDLEAICLTTVYLKFDTHEWGLCGFVNLKDERVSKEHRLSAESLKDIFSSGPKDKFEHQTLTFIDFDLKTMVDFVFKNHENFASSAKLVVVKVLQAFYGWQDVQREFEVARFGNH